MEATRGLDTKENEGIAVNNLRMEPETADKEKGVTIRRTGRKETMTRMERRSGRVA